jgi:hypothetical protein
MMMMEMFLLLLTSCCYCDDDTDCFAGWKRMPVPLRLSSRSLMRIVTELIS